MIDLQQRYEVIKSICESLKLQTKSELRIKSKRQVITSHKARVRRIPSWCLDKLPCDAQVLGEEGMYSYVYH